MKLSITIHEKENRNFALNERDISHLNPKEYLLYSTALCAGLTLQTILEKERIKVKAEFVLKTDGERVYNQQIISLAVNLSPKLYDKNNKQNR